MKIHHLPTHPAYCLDKLQKTKQDFQKQHVVCQKKLQVSKVVMERKRKELAQLKCILAANKKEAQRRRERAGGVSLLFGSDNPAVMQQHYITILEREIVSLQRTSKKLQKMSRAAIKIVNVMEEEYRRAVLLHSNRSKKEMNE